MIAKISHMIGLPFAKYGRGPDAYDCWGVVVETGRIIGEATPDYYDIGHDDGDGVWATVRQEMNRYTRVIEPMPGAIVLFKRLDGRAHFGRVISKRHFIHCNETLGVHISTLDGPYRHLIEGFFVCKIPQ